MTTQEFSTSIDLFAQLEQAKIAAKRMRELFKHALVSLDDVKNAITHEKQLEASI